MATARFAGKCNCGASVEAGTSVTFGKDPATGKTKIQTCPACNPSLAGESGSNGAGPAAPQVDMRVRVQYVNHVGDRFFSIKVSMEGPPPLECPIGEGRQFAVIGRLLPPNVQVGDVLDVGGAFEKDPKWGWQFRSNRALPAVAATDQALVGFLKRFPQIGIARAEQILRHFGGRVAVLEILEKHPARLAEMDGITLERAEEIGKKFAEEAEYRDSILFLSSLNLGDSLQAKVLDAWGQDAKEIVLEDPYQLIELGGVGLKTADDVAQRLNIHRDDPRRVAAAVYTLLEAAAREGCTWSTINDLLSI